METLELIHLQTSQIPAISFERGDDDKFTIEDYAEELPDFPGIYLVFDFEYEEEVDRAFDWDFGPTVDFKVKTKTVSNVRLEDEDCNKVPMDNMDEIEDYLTKHIEIG